MSTIESHFDLSRLPSRSSVGVLSPEIAGEGERIILSDGESLTWDAPPPKAVFPDMSMIKSIKKYFGRQGHQVWPAWVYHPTEEPRLLKSQDEALQLGICFREATGDEFARFGRKQVWDWNDGVQWRPNPYPANVKFNYRKPGAGKTFVPALPDRHAEQNDLMATLVPQVAAAVAQVMRTENPATPSNVDPALWKKFQDFVAWEKTTEVVSEAVAAADAMPDSEAINALAEVAEEGNEEPSNALSEDQERILWAEEAKRKGIKTDGRWSLERLRSEVEKTEKAA